MSPLDHWDNDEIVFCFYKPKMSQIIHCVYIYPNLNPNPKRNPNPNPTLTQP